MKYLENFVENNLEIPNKQKISLKQSLKKINKEFVGYRDDIESKYNELEQLERMYRNLASLGISFLLHMKSQHKLK